jgi:hypothetical protein
MTRPFEGGAPVPPPGPQPHATTVFGIAVWLVPGRPGHCLTWGGEHDKVRLCPLVPKGGGLAFAGAPVEAISGRLGTLAEAQAAIGAWLDNGGPR